MCVFFSFFRRLNDVFVSIVGVVFETQTITRSIGIALSLKKTNLFDGVDDPLGRFLIRSANVVDWQLNGPQSDVSTNEVK